MGECVEEATDVGRDRVVVSAKFGCQVDEDAKSIVHFDETEQDSDVAARLRESIDASLRRLDTDCIDVYLIHVWGLRIERAFACREILEDLVREGKIRTYGWSTDRANVVQAFATSPSCGLIQQQLSVLDGNMELLALCEKLNLASMNRGPLGMGVWTGKCVPNSTFPADDVRHQGAWHPGFKTVAQVEENASAMELGPLTSSQLGEIDQILGRA